MQIRSTPEQEKTESSAKKTGIRLSGPKLGRPSKELSAEEKHIEYKDNTDRIEVGKELQPQQEMLRAGTHKNKA